MEGGGMQGKVELAEALGTTGAVRRVEGENWRERVVGKAAGDEHVFIAGRESGWQIKPAQTPYRTRRAVRAVTGPLRRVNRMA
jgi:hypothetical protein